jgi:phosphoribosyl 1,2-cyclic phosphate phosphodiesterase
MSGQFLFLGTGGSAGVPMIGCYCSVCMSGLKENKRLRSSGLLQVGNKRLLIDVGPDFREQALKFKIDHLDGVLITHPHFDHIGGLDDLRVYYFIDKAPISCLLSQESLDDLKLRYHYMMRPLEPGKSLCAQVEFQILEKDFGEYHFQEIPIQYMSYFQMTTKVTGFRIGSFAYVSDIRDYTDELLNSLAGVEVLVLSALRHVPTLMHFSVEEAIAFTRRVGSKMTYLTHVAHDLEHNTTNAMLPPDVRLSYDGLQISF